MANNKTQTKGNEMAATYKILGINDDRDFCEKCGKTHLRRVVWMVETDSDGGEAGEPFHVGTSCAAYLMHGNKKAASKKTVDLFAKWAAAASRWYAAGHTTETVLRALHQRSGLAVSAHGDGVAFWSRETGSIVATAN